MRKNHIFPLGQKLSSTASRYSGTLTTGRGWYTISEGKGWKKLSLLPFNTPKQWGAFPDEDALARLEAVFFLSQQPQSSRKLAQLANLADGTKARTLVRTLNKRYDAEGFAFRIEELAGGFQLLTRAKFAPWLRRLHNSPVNEVRLSAPAMETLAVVAYRQPILRAEIEAIRGVQSGEVLRQLIERDLVRIVGRSDELGRPFLYGTTRHFLEVFGLKNLDELPQAETLRNSRESVITQSSFNGKKSTLTQPQIAEEETDVTTLINTKPQLNGLEEDQDNMIFHSQENWSEDQDIVAARYDDDDDDDEDEDEDDFDDEDEDEDEDWDDEDFDDEDEPWEEVDDEDEDEDDFDDEEDWDEDEDWDDEDEDWDEDEDEDDDWDDDEDEEEEDD